MQQGIGMHSVAPQNVSPHTYQPQHTAVTGAPVHPQKTEGDVHKIATTANTTTSLPMPSTAVDSPKRQGMSNHLQCVHSETAINY